jgi:hypothetical protein
MIRETGLEARDAIAGERSCFKASSGNHSEPGVTLTSTIILPPGAYASFFMFFLQNILNSSLRREARRDKSEPADRPQRRKRWEDY